MTTGTEIPAGASSASGRMSVAHARFVFALSTLALLAAVTVVGVRRHVDVTFPALYRHTTSLAIAISEARYGTSGFVGLTDVVDVLARHGYGTIPNDRDISYLNTHPAEADSVLREATALPNPDRANTVGLMSSETGLVDIYFAGFKLFGYHIRSFYFVYMALVGVVAVCFLAAFAARPVFAVTSIVFLAVLLSIVLTMDTTNTQVGTLTNARIMPILSLYAILFCLALTASGLTFNIGRALAAAAAGFVFAVAINTRSYGYWQAGPLLVLPVLIVAARHVPNVRFPGWSQVAKCVLWPLVIFGLVAALWIVTSQRRRDSRAYATGSFTGHEYWVTWLLATMPSFEWRIPELEKATGQVIDGPDAYAGALVRLKIMERGEKLSDYVLDGGWWREDKRDPLARQIVFDLWRQYPRLMIETCLRALVEPRNLMLGALRNVGIAAVLLLLGGNGRIMWIVRLVAAPLLGGADALLALAMFACRRFMPDVDTLRPIIPAFALLALTMLALAIVMPMPGPGTIDEQFTVQAVVMVLVCAMPLPVMLRRFFA